MHREHPVPLLLAHVCDRREIGHASVVHEDGNATELLANEGGPGVNGTRDRDVDLSHDSPSLQIADLRRNELGTGYVEIEDADVRSLFCQAEGDCAADAGGTPRYDGRSTF